MKAAYIELRGFRAYGPTAQRLDFTMPLTVIHGHNSQGKTSLVEAVEFLFTGTTSRRLLTGGSPSEFENSLRNAHLDPGETVYVELGLAPTNERTKIKILRRELLCDFRNAEDCTSALTLDGEPIDSVIEAGIALSNPPLAAPVLLEHSLRYAVSAKPGDRSDYFKAVLDVADLDKVRSGVAALITEREATPPPRIIKEIASLSDIPLLSKALRPLLRGGTRAKIEEAIHSALNLIAPPEEQGKSTFTESISRVRAELQSRQSAVFPLEALVCSAPKGLHALTIDRDPSNQVDGEERLAGQAAWLLDGYQTALEAVNEETAALVPLLETALRIPLITHISDNEPIDCPLCATSRSLTAPRVNAIRDEIASRKGVADIAKHLEAKLGDILRQLSAIKDSVQGSIPSAVQWSAEERASYRTAANRLGVAFDMYDLILDQVDHLSTNAKAVSSKAEETITLITALKRLARDMQPIGSVDAENASKAIKDLDDLTDAQIKCLTDYCGDERLLSDIVKPKLEEGSSTFGWSILLDLGDNVPSVEAALAAHTRFNVATARLKKAKKLIDEAARTALDKRLLMMGDEISKWWSFMRPGELTEFDRITRRGAGNKFLDVTAALSPDDTAPGIVRNALAVLSTSQINALGLAAFLARCQMLGAPFILLDDPVPGSDREHRGTFASSVVEGLLQSGQQVIIATHDAELARNLHSIHQHIGVDKFEVNLLEPREGSQLVRTGDDFENLLLEASAQMHSPMRENRRAAGNSLRIATERLAKMVIVAGRRQSGDASAQIADYDGKNLRDLRPMAITYAVQSNEPGRWQQIVNILNDADHDTEPPLPAELKLCHNTLRDLKKQHKSHGHDVSGRS